MALDAVTVSELANELNSTLRGCRIDKIYQPSKCEIFFATRVNNKNTRIKISISSKPYIYLTDEKQTNPDKAPMFCMLLRKHLSGAKILSVSAPQDERIIIISLESINEMGDIVKRTIVLELMGRNSNFILCDENNRILDCIKRVDYESSSERPLLPGLFYNQPPKPEKISLSAISSEEFMRCLKNAPDIPVSKWLADTFSSISPLISRELAFRACGDIDAVISRLSESQAESMANDVVSLHTGNHAPYLIFCEGESLPFEFSFMPITQYGNAVSKKCADYCSMLAEFFDKREYYARLEQAKNELRKIITTFRQRLSKKLAEQTAELQQAKEREYLKRHADLIMANIGTIHRGQSSAKVTDWFDEAQPTVEIKLDVKMNAHQNAQKYYKLYSKRKNAESVLTVKLAEGQSELFYLDSILDETTRACDISELAEIKEELQENGYIKSAAKQKKKAQTISKPAEYRTTGGFSVFVGKNNRQNEYLTLKAAFKSDIWFHVKNAPGAHVILVCDGRQPSDSDLTQAAEIAAFHSSISSSVGTAVDYTTVKNVKKLHGGKTGMVNYFNYQTAFVTPDPQKLQSLRIN